MAEKGKRQTAKKTAKRKKRSRPSTKLQPGGKGGTQLPAGNHPGNTGGKKGRSGPIPTQLKVSCQDLAFGYVFPKLEKYLKRSNVGVSNAGWRWAATTVLDRGFGKVPQPITGDDEGDPIGLRVERERAALGRILGRLARIAERAEKG